MQKIMNKKYAQYSLRKINYVNYKGKLEVNKSEKK